ncbi:MAG TPA: aldehyde dehydrogenase family protein [Roseiflexaceae bacterium]|nr:aldehyde dehydrogenase family protein [Roseiflexaceae bacterium]
MKLYQNLLGGSWQTSQSAERVPNRNPADRDEVLGELPLSTPAEAEQAAEAAGRAYREWRRVPAPKRGALVAQAARLMAERREQIAAALSHEEGKPLAEARGELARTINILEFCGAQGRRLAGETIPLELTHNFGYTVRQPLGVVALITPWNFPVAIPAWKIAPALVAGNTAVLKPSPLTPESSELVVRCFEDAGLPPGVLNLVHGEAPAARALIDHPEVRAVSFTGSTPVGLAIYQQAARRGIRAQCEMGGKNPVVVLEDADLDLAVAGVVSGAFGATGQRCTATSRVILQDTIADAFMERLVAAVGRLRLGDGRQEGVDVGPLVDERQLLRVLDAIEAAKGEGAELVCGGGRATEGALVRGNFVLPTVFDRVRPGMRLAQEEIFGPVLAVLRVAGFDEALEAANDSAFGLTSSIYTRDLGAVFRFIDAIETGMTHVNSPTLGGEAQLPFGGVKASAVGPLEQGEEVFDFFSQTKVVYIDYTGAQRQGKLY